MRDNAGAVALLGFPRTGKSTFLGALWQFIQDDVNGSIRESNTAGDRAYLQLLGEAVAQYSTVARTELDSDGGMHLRVDLADIGEVNLAVPDIAGEALGVLIENRSWPNALLANVQSASAILLFLHPDEMVNPGRAAEALLLMEGHVAPREGATSPAVFEARRACTSACLLDVLENALASNSARSIRVALVVSAWDLVDGVASPTEWAMREVPAVMNFLRFHDRITYTAFGVSAQGGALPERLDELIALGSVSERAYAIDGEGRRVPISAPIAWAVAP